MDAQGSARRVKDESREPMTEAEAGARDAVIELHSHADALTQEALLGEAMTNANYVILVADERMRYLAASDAACDLLGYTRDELLGLTVPDLVVESNASELYDEFLQDHAQHGVITLRRRDGRAVIANYDARETIVAGLPYYVSVLTPLSPSAAHDQGSGNRERGLRELKREGFLTERELEIELERRATG